ncbi:F-box protein SKIP19 isoform X2 [Manihot esculenta]|uniref:Uncharacterized protein n=3 Tax=Manihot esculenta TaxID=3983 RepID=A0ACB7GH16_MANES|nr:F-box protein SKIP19 isoform X2 [Manihot esculenta]KAG8639201.1 hypothetical protein MANES_14G135100v8 [Manihot esculenta]KAG8639202.1 hypothetical protein MANES_14G135100v8 [Manihot esculenta]OAY31725.1 hypothetical protein MANES_14G135100v8 [Manihot esculenta]
MDSLLLPPQEPYRNWVELPRDITASILLKLGAVEILNTAQLVCSSWRSICKDPSMWRSIDMRNLGDLWDMDYDLEKMCRHAVDRSSGGLVDIDIQYFGTDDLLQYIADRSSHLKRLRLVSCYSISDEGLSEVATKFPLLEELDISYCSLSKQALEVVGHCCPLLKSFKLNNHGFKHPRTECNEEALVIAENMPHLCCLQIFGNKLTNEGLQAILDGCPNLESLDLRQCFNVNLEGHLDVGSSEEDYPSGLSEIDFLSDDDDYYEFSGGSDMSDYGDLVFDY